MHPTGPTMPIKKSYYTKFSRQRSLWPPFWSLWRFHENRSFCSENIESTKKMFWTIFFVAVCCCRFQLPGIPKPTKNLISTNVKKKNYPGFPGVGGPWGSLGTPGLPEPPGNPGALGIPGEPQGVKLKNVIKIVLKSVIKKLLIPPPGHLQITSNPYFWHPGTPTHLWVARGVGLTNHKHVSFSNIYIYI